MKRPQVISRILISLLLLTNIALVSACGSAANEAFPTGTYAPPVQRTPGIEMVFSNDGTYVMSGPKFTPVKGTYVVDKDKIVFTQTEGGLCSGVPGTYTWSFDGKALTFAVVDDQCSIRRVDWQAGPWMKQS